VLIRIALGEDQPFMEILPEVLRNYGRAVQYGNRNIYQSLPRMLTIWFEYGNYCYANVRQADNKASPLLNAALCSLSIRCCIGQAFPAERTRIVRRLHAMIVFMQQTEP
jgi:hypothetical protein